MKRIILIALLLLSISLQAQDTRAKLTKLINDFKAKYPSNGVSIGVIRDDSIYYFSVGNTGNIPITEHTVFEIGSLTKPFTGLLLGLEIEKKHIDKNSFIDSYLPPGVHLRPGIRRKVKMTDLGSHQSGLPNFNDDQYIMALFKKDPEQPFRSASKAYLFQVLEKTDTLVNHGTYSYNNYAVALLGQLLAIRSHQTYAALLKHAVLEPMHLKNTTLNDPAQGAPVAGRFDDKGDVKPAMIINAMTPAGGLHSNAIDMINFLRKQLFPSNDQMGKAIKMSQQTFYRDKELSVGLGWEMQNGMIEKTGDTWGNSSMLSFDPEKHVGVVVLSDHRDAQLVQDITVAIWKEIK